MRTFGAAVTVVTTVLTCGLASSPAQGAAQAPATEPAGDPAAGTVHFTFGNTSCTNCHGAEGQGAFGPPLAGGHLTFERFRSYVRKPLGRMPAYADSELTDQEIADMVAYFRTVPAGAKPLPWRTPLPENAPRGQQLAVAVIGCAQCHGATFETPRHGAAEVSADFDWFKRQVYEHNVTMREHWRQLDLSLQPVTPLPSGPPGRNRIRMGNYSPTQVPESTLKELWSWMNDMGVYLAVLRGRITPGAVTSGSASYTVEVINTGVKGKGVTNEDIVVSIAVPPGTRVLDGGGPGYAGIRHDDHAKADVVVWRLATLAAGDRRSFTLTLSAPAQGALNGTIRWGKPAVAVDDEVRFALAPGTGGA